MYIQEIYIYIYRERERKKERERKRERQRERESVANHVALFVQSIIPEEDGQRAADWGKTAWKGGGSSSAEGAGMKGEDSVASAGPAPDKDGRSRSPHRRKDGDSDAVAQSATIASDALMERIKALGVRNGVNVKKKKIYIYIYILLLFP